MADNVTTTTSSPAGFPNSTKFATKDSTNDGHITVVQLGTTDGTDVTVTDVGSLLNSIKTAVEVLDNAISGAEIQADIVSSALPSGASTAANQTTIIGHVDGVETLLGTIDADTGSIATSASAIATDAAAIEVLVQATNDILDGTTDGVTVFSRPAMDSATDNVGLYALPANLVQGVTAAITGTSNTEVLAAAGASVRNYVTSITVTNSHATVGTVVEIKDGTTVIHRGYAAPLGGGYTVNFLTPLKGTANTAINAANVTTGSNTYVSASGFTAA
jgi:hypothetical protein